MVDKFGLKLERLIHEAGIVQGKVQQGEAFGEFNKLNSNNRRAMSILTSTVCELIVINKNDYEDMVKKLDVGRRIKNEFMESKIPFLSSISSQESWDILSACLHELEYCIGTTVIVENTKGKKIYFLAQGECELEKTVLLNVKNERLENEILKLKKAFATVGVGACLGEEIIFNSENTYLYTIKV